MQPHHFTGQTEDVVKSDNSKINAMMLEENENLRRNVRMLQVELSEANKIFRNQCEKIRNLEAEVDTCKTAIKELESRIQTKDGTNEDYSQKG